MGRGPWTVNCGPWSVGRKAGTLRLRSGQASGARERGNRKAGSEGAKRQGARERGSKGAERQRSWSAAADGVCRARKKRLTDFRGDGRKNSGQEDKEQGSEGTSHPSDEDLSLGTPAREQGQANGSGMVADHGISMRRKGEIIGRFGGRNLLMFSAGCGAGSEKALDKKRGNVPSVPGFRFSTAILTSG